MTAIYGQLRSRLRLLDHMSDGAADGVRYVVATAHYLPDGRNPHRERAAVAVGATLEYRAQVTDRTDRRLVERRSQPWQPQHP